MLHEIGEYRENLRLDVAKLAASTQLAAREIQLAVTELEDHGPEDSSIFQPIHNGRFLTERLGGGYANRGSGAPPMRQAIPRHRSPSARGR